MLLPPRYRKSTLEALTLICCHGDGLINREALHAPISPSLYMQIHWGVSLKKKKYIRGI